MITAFNGCVFNSAYITVYVEQSLCILSISPVAPLSPLYRHLSSSVHCDILLKHHVYVYTCWHPLINSFESSEHMFEVAAPKISYICIGLLCTDIMHV